LEKQSIGGSLADQAAVFIAVAREKSMNRKILVVLTSVEKYPNLNRATGLWLGEAVHFVKKVEAAGYAVDYVSPKGGYTPIDPHSLAMAEPIDWEWYQKKEFMNRLGATLAPSEVKPDDYAAIYYAGGHGVIWDFPRTKPCNASAARFTNEAASSRRYAMESWAC
jgi:putative intracellular protease/amidase